MLTVAYLAIEFPSPVEPYVACEIEELRRRGVTVIAGSVRRAGGREGNARSPEPEVVLQGMAWTLAVRAIWLCVRRWRRVAPLLGRVMFRGAEGLGQRVRALAHTFLGACYACLLEQRRAEHIHVHHGYFASWIGMTAARILNIGFSLTLHGSDLLLHGTYLDLKLATCTFCCTISSYNRNYILEHYPGVDAGKIIVSRMGVDVPERLPAAGKRDFEEQPLTILCVGRLHAVKDHAFLVRACAELKARKVKFRCFIAGDGPERRRLSGLIRKFHLDARVVLLGHVQPDGLDGWYRRADVAVLTSRSEGIPLVLMEAMARGKIVLAPSITGIPELVVPEKSGFLYAPGSMHDFVSNLLLIEGLVRESGSLGKPGRSASSICTPPRVEWIQHAARTHVSHNFNRRKNLEFFCDSFLQRIHPQTESIHENFVLQQIQLSVQRDRSLPI